MIFCSVIVHWLSLLYNIPFRNISQVIHANNDETGILSSSATMNHTTANMSDYVSWPERITRLQTTCSQLYEAMTCCFPRQLHYSYHTLSPAWFLIVFMSLLLLCVCIIYSVGVMRTALEVREHLCAGSSLPPPLTGRTGDWSQVTGSAQQGPLPTEPHCQSSWIILLSIKPVFGSQEARWIAVRSSSLLWTASAHKAGFLPTSLSSCPQSLSPCNKHVSALSEPVPIISPAKLFFLIYLYFVSWFVFCPAWRKLESCGKSKSQLRKQAELRKWLHQIDCRQVQGIF